MRLHGIARCGSSFPICLVLIVCVTVASKNGQSTPARISQSSPANPVHSYVMPRDLEHAFLNQTQWPVPILRNTAQAKTPPMGFSFWNGFGDDPGPNDLLCRQMADALVSTGLRDAGYVYFLAFDGAWWTYATNPARDSSGHPRIDESRWPNGIQAVSDYIHRQGLKVGGYTDIGVQGYLIPAQVGVLGFEQQDADQFAQWGWDYVKVDDHGPGNFYSIARAIVHNSSQRPMVLSFSTPHTFPYEFAPRIGNLWRVGQDITLRLGVGAWKDVVREFDAGGQFWWAQAPGRWNDLDMLLIGHFGLTDEEIRSHLSMWAIRGAPLLIGADIRPPHERSFGPVPRLSIHDLEMLENTEMIGVDQDVLGASGRVVSRDREAIGEVDAKPLGSFASGEYAVLLLNRGTKSRNITVTWHDLGLLPAGASVRDLWKHADLGSFRTQFTAHGVPSHGVRFLRIKGSIDWSLPREYEAESSYNTFEGMTHTRCLRTAAGKVTDRAVVEGIGGSPENTLQFNQIWEDKAGLYGVVISYATREPRDANIHVNGQPPLTVHFPATGNESRFETVHLQVRLQRGENHLLIDNPTSLAPTIDKIRIFVQKAAPNLTYITPHTKPYA